MQTNINNASLLQTRQKNSVSPKGDSYPMPPSPPSTSSGLTNSPPPPQPPDTNPSHTGDAEKPFQDTENTDSVASTLPLDSLNEMEKVRAIGELSRINSLLDSFIQEELAAFDPQSTPSTRTELLKKWNSLAPPDCSSTVVQKWVDREILQKLDQTGIALERNHELARISDARKSWTSQLEQARNSNDEESIRHWEQLGKGIFYPAGEEKRQKDISRRFSDYKTVQELMNTQPSLVLEYIQNATTEDNLPPSIKSYWETQARKSLAVKQENFYKSLIENELKGTPYREDLLTQAEQQHLISPERRKAYLERFSEDRPLRDEDSLSLPFMNALYTLIHTYSPDRDIKGERRRSIYALIAESDCEPEKKGNLIRQFARQRNNPELARLRTEAASYLRERYERDGFGEFSGTLISSDEETTEELRSILGKSKENAWLASEKKWASAQKAIDAYLEEHEGALPSRREWKTLIPKLVYKAVRTPRRVFADNDATFRGYPLLAGAPPSLIPLADGPATKTDPPSPTDTSTSDIPQTWKETLARYFSEHPDVSPQSIRVDMKSLYNQWINRKDASSPSRPATPDSSEMLIS